MIKIAIVLVYAFKLYPFLPILNIITEEFSCFQIKFLMFSFNIYYIEFQVSIHFPIGCLST